MRAQPCNIYHIQYYWLIDLLETLTVQRYRWTYFTEIPGKKEEKKKYIGHESFRACYYSSKVTCRAPETSAEWALSIYRMGERKQKGS